MTPLQQAAQAVIDRCHEYNQRELPALHLALRKALDAELQQAVEPVARVESIMANGRPFISRLPGARLNEGDSLYLHPAPQQAVTSGERAELIQWLRRAHEVFGNKNSKTIADMLEADDVFRPDWVNYRQGVKDGKAEEQQAKPKTMGDVQDMCIAALQRDECAKVGDSRFESWYSELNQAGKGSKQIAREAYEAGLNEADAQQAKQDKARLDWLGPGVNQL